MGSRAGVIAILIDWWRNNVKGNIFSGIAESNTKIKQIIDVAKGANLTLFYQRQKHCDSGPKTPHYGPSGSWINFGYISQKWCFQDQYAPQLSKNAQLYRTRTIKTKASGHAASPDTLIHLPDLRRAAPPAHEVNSERKLALSVSSCCVKRRQRSTWWLA